MGGTPALDQSADSMIGNAGEFVRRLVGAWTIESPASAPFRGLSTSPLNGQDEHALVSHARHAHEVVDDVLGLQFGDDTALLVEHGNPVGEAVAGTGVDAHRGHMLTLDAALDVVGVDGVALGAGLAAQGAQLSHPAPP